MEQEGIKTIMHRMKEGAIKVSAIITDGHRSVQKWLRENCKDTKHYLDAWHVAKGEKCVL